MPDIQIDRAQLAPSILPADLPELSDDECIALIGRLAVTIE